MKNSMIVLAAVLALGGMMAGCVVVPEATQSTPSSMTRDVPEVNLDDMLGMKARNLDSTMESRGFANAGGYKTGDASITTWWNASTRQCVNVETRQGRVDAMNEVDGSECKSGARGSSSGADDEAASDPSVRAGRGDFDATGKVPCAQYAGQPMGQCDFGVSRAGGGTATVVVTKPDGVKRTLFFTKGEFVSADTSQADGYPEYGAEKENDLFMIRVGDERYEIPDAVVWGG